MPQENLREINKDPAQPHLGGAAGAAQMGFIRFLLISLRFSCVCDIIKQYIKLYFTCRLLGVGVVCNVTIYD